MIRAMSSGRTLWDFIRWDISSSESSLHLSDGSLNRSRRGDLSREEKNRESSEEGSFGRERSRRFRDEILMFLSFSRKQFKSRMYLDSRDSSI